MRRSYIFTSITATVVLLLSAAAAAAQVAPLRGHVVLKQADGTSVKPADAVIDVYRTDISGVFHTKTDKKGEFVFAGLPFVGRYVVAASLPNAAPYALNKVKVGRDVDYEIVLTPGDGHRYTEAEAKSAAASRSGNSPATGNGGR